MGRDGALGEVPLARVSRTVFAMRVGYTGASAQSGAPTA
jgi:hypothetical protein